MKYIRVYMRMFRKKSLLNIFLAIYYLEITRIVRERVV